MNVSADNIVRGKSMSALITMVLLSCTILLTFLIYLAARIALIEYDHLWILYIIDLIVVITLFVISVIIKSTCYAIYVICLSSSIVCFAFRFVDTERLYFLLNKNNYLKDIRNTDLLKSPVLIFKFKDGSGFPAGGAWEYFVYDASNQIVLAPDKRDEDWERRYGNYLKPPNQDCSVYVRKMEPKFYYVLQKC